MAPLQRISPLPRSYRIVTLGCKLNQFDSASIEGQLRARGFAPAAEGDPAGVIVINTCTVTENADREARRLARRARRENPDCRLLLTGCYAERDRERLTALDEVDEVIGHSDRERIPEVLDALSLESAAPSRGVAAAGKREAPAAARDAAESAKALRIAGPPSGMPAALAGPGVVVRVGQEKSKAEDAQVGPPRAGAAAYAEIACIEASAGLPALCFGERTRAFLKVQEGCDLNCSYCIIPSVRGRSRSIGPGRLEAELAGLVARGYREIVLTGVNTGDYGKDLAPRTSLAALLGRLLAVPGLGRLRLNSLEPRTVRGEIVGLLSAEPLLARHLQVPLQSGCDRTLKRMYRNYRTADYGRVVETLRARVPGIGLGADVIVGFPGETDEDFEETCRFVETSPLNYLHVFSYSDRPGTPASSMEGHVHPRTVHERSARLRAIGASLGLKFRRSFVGKELEVLVYHERRSDGRLRALSDNFIDMGIETGDEAMNRIVKATVVRVDSGDTIGVASFML